MERMIAFICERKRKGRHKVSSPINILLLTLFRYPNSKIEKLAKSTLLKSGQQVKRGPLHYTSLRPTAIMMNYFVSLCCHMRFCFLFMFYFLLKSELLFRPQVMWILLTRGGKHSSRYCIWGSVSSHIQSMDYMYWTNNFAM